MFIQVIAYSTGPLGLILGQIASQGLGSSKLVRGGIIGTNFRQHISWANIRRVAAEYREFPLFSTWSALFNSAGTQLAPLAFMYLFGSVVAGFYALTFKILALPATLIGRAIGNVLLAHAPEAHREGNLRKLIEPIFSKMVHIGLPGLALLLIWGPELFDLIFGPKWHKAGEYAQWMAPWLYLKLQWTPISVLSSILQLQGQALIAESLSLLGRMIVLAICVMVSATPDNTVFSFAMAGALSYLLMIGWLLSKTNIPIITIIKHQLHPPLIFFSLCSPVISEHIFHNRSITIFCYVYFVCISIIWLAKKPLRKKAIMN